MLAISSPSTPDDPGSIVLISSQTGEAIRRLTNEVRPYVDNRPVFSPDGKSIAYLRNSSISASEIYIVSVSGGTPKAITADRRSITGLTWTADSRELIFSANLGGVGGLWRIPAQGGTPEHIPVNGKNPTSPVISRQGDRLAYTDRYTDSQFYLYEGPGFAGRPVPGKFGGRKLLDFSSTREDTSPQFSPDGERLVFTSQRTGSEEVWICRSDGSQLKRLTDFDGRAAGSPRWSPDGRWIAFDSRAAGSPDIYIISAEGGKPRQLTTDSHYDSKPNWSNDGKYIYFASNRSDPSSTKTEIWKMPVEGGPAVQLTHSGALEGFESPDGKLFYFSKNRGVYGLWSVTVEGTDEKPVPELKQAGYWRSWGLLKEGIYYVSKEPGERQTIRFFSFVTRKVTPLLMVEKDALYWEPGLTLSQNGRQLIYSQIDHIFNDLLLEEGFR
ncbi:MAG: hypothetical protein HOP19_26470 [Acidobacteria bacterium]|nr:hypothetical protein [Acidobacteriota bacterium]